MPLTYKQTRVFSFMTNIKIRKHIRSKTDDGVNDYIESLENFILELKASNTLNLIFKLDEINGTIVEDLDKVISGEAVKHEVVDGELVEISQLKVLHESSQNKTFDRVMVLFSKLKDLKAVADLVASMIPDIEEQESIKSKIKLEKGKNLFESIQEQIKK